MIGWASFYFLGYKLTGSVGFVQILRHDIKREICISLFSFWVHGLSAAINGGHFLFCSLVATTSIEMNGRITAAVLMMMMLIVSAAVSASNTNTIMDVLRKHSDRFSLITMALQRSGVADILQKRRLLYFSLK